MDKLLNCPFCGSQAKLLCAGYVSCDNRDCPISAMSMTVEAWQTRAPSAVEQAVIRVANNALYFDDNSDYGSALWEVCELLGMDKDAIGADFIEEALLAKKGTL